MKASILMLCLGLSFSATTFADENLQAQFKTAYQNYLTAQKAPDGAKTEAKQAYQLGKKLFGEQADNTANLAVNYANEINSQGEKPLAARHELYQQAYSILVANHNESDLIVMDALLGMAETAPSAYKSNNYFKELIDIAEQNENPKLAMDMKFAAAQHLASNHAADRFITARNYLEEADEYYQANLPNNSIERVKADFLVAAFAEGRKDYDEAILRLNNVVTVFDQALEFDHNTELNAHSKLVALYERTGQSDEATKHCIAIAKMVPWKESQEQTPLYRQNPEYPMSKVKQRRDGSVQMEFDITKSGFVENIKVLNSEGGSAFEREAVAAMKKWRYAPKFENGQAVVATSHVQLDFKIN